MVLKEGSSMFYRYNKISQQKKFHLLSLVLKERRSIKQAAEVVGINYSTAKTIIFFHRNQLKSYQFGFSTYPKTQKPQLKVIASYKLINNYSPSTPHDHQTFFSPQQVQVISSLASGRAAGNWNGSEGEGDVQLDNPSSSTGRAQSTNTAGLSFLDLRQKQICQCERRITRAQSAKQAARINLYRAPQRRLALEENPPHQRTQQ